jgi:PIN domain nuclease of toxin-antitoxin system
LTSRPILLDTCASIWLLDDKLNASAVAEFVRADAEGVPIYISPITAWEIGILVARNRIALSTSPSEWFAVLLEQGVRLAPLTPDILIDSSFLPGGLHNDPADRVIVATARSLGCRLMTRDRPLLDYAARGHLQAIPC